MLIAKAIELEHADKAIQSGTKDLSHFESQVEKLKEELNEMFGRKKESTTGQGCGSRSCSKFENFGLKAFTKDLRENFKGLDDIYVWHALFGAWGRVRPKISYFNSYITPCKVFPGLDGSMDNLAVTKIVEGGNGLIHPDEAGDFYESMHSHLSDYEITGVKMDVILVSNLFFINYTFCIWFF